MKDFIAAARNVGADVQVLSDLRDAVGYIKERVAGSILVAPCASLVRT